MTSAHRPRRRTPRPAAAGAPCLALALALALLLGACSADDDERPDGSGTAATGPGGASPTATPEPPETWPLTGLSVPAGHHAARRRPVVVVKMDNTAASAPQVGLGDADLVVEELVEGGLTRLAAMYYSHVPTLAGPVRSMRASDIAIVKPARASVVTSGAASVTISRIRGAGIRYYNEGSTGFFRDDERSSPYNLFTHLRETVALTRAAAQRPVDYLPWGAADALPEGRPATTLVARFGTGHSTEWAFVGDQVGDQVGGPEGGPEGGHYVDENSFAAEGDRFVPDTVLVLHVRVGDAGYLDPAGNPVPETLLRGTGKAELFHGGRRIRAQWAKASPDATVTLKKHGLPLAVPTGHTWIELVPETTGSVTFAP